MALAPWRGWKPQHLPWPPAPAPRPSVLWGKDPAPPGCSQPSLITALGSRDHRGVRGLSSPAGSWASMDTQWLPQCRVFQQFWLSGYWLVFWELWFVQGRQHPVILHGEHSTPWSHIPKQYVTKWNLTFFTIGKGSRVKLLYFTSELSSTRKLIKVIPIHKSSGGAQHWWDAGILSSPPGSVVWPLLLLIALFSCSREHFSQVTKHPLFFSFVSFPKLIQAEFFFLQYFQS